MRKYMLDIVAAKKHSSTAKMELIPGFYALYSNIALKIMRKTDLQESEQTHGKNYFNLTIKKCLWHTACVENGCAELCRLFCDVDNVTYGGLKKNRLLLAPKPWVTAEIAVIFIFSKNSFDYLSPFERGEILFSKGFLIIFLNFVK